MDNSIYLAQEEQRINSLISVKKYREAYDLCKQLLLRFPEEKDILKLKARIEKESLEDNEKVIDEKLQTLKPFWKSENYVEILRILKGLFPLAPDSEKLKKLYLEAQTKYQKQINALQEEFVRKQRERLDELLEKFPNMLIESLFDLEKQNPGNKVVLDLTRDYRDKLIARKMKEKEELIYSDKFNDIQNFIEQLKKIDENNHQIRDLERLIHGSRHENQLTQKSEFIYAGEKHLDTLIKLKKFDKVVKVAEEILGVDIHNKKVQKILQTYSKKYLKQLHKLTAENIKKNFPALKADYLKDKSLFIKL